MRPGPNKRSRGRNNGNNPHHNRPRLPHRIQTFDSNGPNVKIRGNAYQVFERYVALAREAAASGDRIAAENLYQHAEHYFRVMNANGEGQNQGQPRPMTPADTEMTGGAEMIDGADGERRDSEENGAAQHVQHSVPQHPGMQPQPMAQPEMPPDEQPPYEQPPSY